MNPPHRLVRTVPPPPLRKKPKRHRPSLKPRRRLLRKRRVRQSRRASLAPKRPLPSVWRRNHSGCARLWRCQEHRPQFLLRRSRRRLDPCLRLRGLARFCRDQGSRFPEGFVRPNRSAWPPGRRLHLLLGRPHQSCSRRRLRRQAVPRLGYGLPRGRDLRGNRQSGPSCRRGPTWPPNFRNRDPVRRYPRAPAFRCAPRVLHLFQANRSIAGPSGPVNRWWREARAPEPRVFVPADPAPCIRRRAA